jgi:hypothetical protein
MMLAGLSCRAGAIKNAASLTRMMGSNASKAGTTLSMVTRTMTSEAKTSGFARHFERRRMLKPSVVAVPGSAFNIGRGAVAAASALGLGALAFYGLGMSDEAGAIDRHMVWPEAVRARIRDTYLYFGASLGVTAGTAAAIFRYVLPKGFPTFHDGERKGRSTYLPFCAMLGLKIIVLP